MIVMTNSLIQKVVSGSEMCCKRSLVQSLRSPSDCFTCIAYYMLLRRSPTNPNSLIQQTTSISSRTRLTSYSSSFCRASGSQYLIFRASLPKHSPTMATILGSKPDSKFYTFKPLDSEFDPSFISGRCQLLYHEAMMMNAQDLH